MQAFNTEQFLNTTHTEASSTELVLVPEGEYIGVSDAIGPDSFRTFDIGKGERAGQQGYSLDVQFLINDEGGTLKEFLGRSPKVKYGMMLDITKDGTLEFGKGRNVGLGRLREAFGQNGAGKPWQFSMLGGQVAKIKVKHRLDQKSGKTFAEVSEVTKM